MRRLRRLPSIESLPSQTPRMRRRRHRYRRSLFPRPLGPTNEHNPARECKQTMPLGPAPLSDRLPLPRPPPRTATTHTPASLSAGPGAPVAVPQAAAHGLNPEPTASQRPVLAPSLANDLVKAAVRSDLGLACRGDQRKLTSAPALVTAFSNCRSTASTVAQDSGPPRSGTCSSPLAHPDACRRGRIIPTALLSRANRSRCSSILVTRAARWNKCDHRTRTAGAIAKPEGVRLTV